MEREQQCILKAAFIPGQRGIGRMRIQRNPISTKPVVLCLVFSDEILRRQDSPLLQKNEAQSRLGTPASEVVCNLRTDKFQKKQAGNSYVGFRMFVSVFVQLVINWCI